MNDEVLAELLHDAAQAAAAALAGIADWGPSGRRDGQYAADLVVDDAVLAVLRRAEVGVLSEESGLEHPERAVIVIVDPLDGSTNASRGVPWFATSLCAVDADGPRASLVVQQCGAGARYDAVRGGGARKNGVELVAPGAARDGGPGRLASSIVALSGYPRLNLGWEQFRAFGAGALDLCLVAEGVVDAFVDCVDDGHGVWDYAGAWLVCAEVGVPVVDALGRDLIVRDPGARRTPVAARTPGLLAEVLAARASVS